jgi:hypothetical protein
MSGGIKIDLAEDERETLLHLLHTLINDRVWEAVRGARREELERAAQRAIRLVQLEDLEAEGVLRGDLERHGTDLVIWACEADETTKEHSEQIVEAEQEDLTYAERTARINRLRERTAVDYAHRCVCERITEAIKANRAVLARGDA